MVAVLAANMIYDRHFDASIRENMIDRKKIRLRYELASGQFGEVYKGMYRVFQLDMLHFKRLLGHQKSTFKS